MGYSEEDLQRMTALGDIVWTGRLSGSQKDAFAAGRHLDVVRPGTIGNEFRSGLRAARILEVGEDYVILERAKSEERLPWGFS